MMSISVSSKNLLDFLCSKAERMAAAQARAAEKATNGWNPKADGGATQTTLHGLWARSTHW